MTQTTAVTFKDKKASVQQLIKRYERDIALALPRHMTPERMMRVAMTAVTREPKLLDCTPYSLMGSIMQASQLGLEPDGIMNQAHLVPFNNRKTGKLECQLMIGYKGIENLCRNSGEVVTIDGEVVREKDHFRWMLGLDPQLEHKPFEGEDAGEIIAAYAVATLCDGSKRFKVLLRHELDAVKQMSQSGRKDQGPWVTHFPDMCIKTAIKRIGKRLPMSVEAQRAIHLDDMAEAGIAQNLDALIMPKDSPDDKSTLDNLAKKLDPKNKVEAEAKESAAEPEQRPLSNGTGAPVISEGGGVPNKAESGAPDPVPDEDGCKKMLGTMRTLRGRKEQLDCLGAILDSACYDTEWDPANIKYLIAEDRLVAAVETMMRWQGWL